MERILTQIEIDELIRVINAGALQEWKTKYGTASNNNVRFKHNEVYKIIDGGVFHHSYILEELTSGVSIIRRYAYGDTESYKKYKHFMVLEDYKDKGINAAAVVGIAADKYELNHNYNYDRNHGAVYLINAAALSFAYCLNEDGKSNEDK